VRNGGRGEKLDIGQRLEKERDEMREEGEEGEEGESVRCTYRNFPPRYSPKSVL
jgi:hypothetical protein